MTPVPDSGRMVVNVDALWGADARWYRLGDVSLGDRGVPQLVVFYAAAGVLAGWVVTGLPVVGLRFWPTGLLTALAVTAAGFVRPGGLRVHQFVPTVAAHFAAPRHLHGWQACRPPRAEWRPPVLVLEGDGSGPRFEPCSFMGPGLIVRHRAARRTVAPARMRDRVAGRERQVLEQLPGDAVLPEGREFAVPAGVTVIVRGAR